MTVYEDQMSLSIFGPATWLFGFVCYVSFSACTIHYITRVTFVCFGDYPDLLIETAPLLEIVA